MIVAWPASSAPEPNAAAMLSLAPGDDFDVASHAELLGDVGADGRQDLQRAGQLGQAAGVDAGAVDQLGRTTSWHRARRLSVRASGIAEFAVAAILPVKRALR